MIFILKKNNFTSIPVTFSIFNKMLSHERISSIIIFRVWWNFFSKIEYDPRSLFYCIIKFYTFSHRYKKTKSLMISECRFPEKIKLEAMWLIFDNTWLGRIFPVAKINYTIFFSSSTLLLLLLLLKLWSKEMLSKNSLFYCRCCYFFFLLFHCHGKKTR